MHCIFGYFLNKKKQNKRNSHKFTQAYQGQHAFEFDRYVYQSTKRSKQSQTRSMKIKVQTHLLHVQPGYISLINDQIIYLFFLLFDFVLIFFPNQFTSALFLKLNIVSLKIFKSFFVSQIPFIIFVCLFSILTTELFNL